MIQRSLLAVILVAALVVTAGVNTGGGITNSTNGVFFDHVLVIVMENQPITSTYNCGSVCDPFLTPFANSNGLALNYVRVEDGSLPNYFGLTMGQINQNPFPGADCSPHPGDTRKLPNGTVISNYCPQSSFNIVDRLESAGLTWKDYQENYPGSGSGSSYYSSGGCYIGYSHYNGNVGIDPTYYAADHNTFVYYTDIVNSTSRCSRIVAANSPQTSNPLNDNVLLSDLNNPNVPAPNYMSLTPDECDQMHHVCNPGTTNDQAVQQGSNYLSQLLPQILNSWTFQNTRSALVVTFDENCANLTPPGCGPTSGSSNVYPFYTVWASHNSIITKGGFQSSNPYNHYSLLKTIEYNWNLAPLTSNDANANLMLEFFNPLPPNFSISANPTSVSLNAGSAGASTISVSPQNGFAGTVNLSVKTNSSNLSCSLSSTSISGGSGSSTLQCSSSVGANYLATVDGTSGSISHSATVTYHVFAPKPIGPQYVVVIVLENQPLSGVYGSGCGSECSYITQLANTYGIALDYSGVGHFSLPNYLTLTSGGNYSYQPYVNNCLPSPLCQVSGANLLDTVEQSGRTWRAYMEDYTGGGCTNIGGIYYAPDHNPFLYYADISSNITRCGYVVNANPGGSGYLSMPTTLLSDLNGASPPNLMWLSPNECNNGEQYRGNGNCPGVDGVTEQNSYLHALVPAILNSTTFKNQPSALYITWDEGTNCPAPGQTFPTCLDPVAAIWAGPTVRQGYQSSIAYSHYNFIPTLEHFWNLFPLPLLSSINSLPMLDFFAPTSIISVIKGPNNSILWDAFLSGSWRGWQSLPGATASAAALCPSSAGRIDVLIRGTDNSIYHSSFTNAVWSGSWDGPGGGTLDQPSCALLNGNLYVAIRGTDNAIWIASMSLSTGQWSSWTGLGGGTLSTPALVATPSLNRLDVVIRGTDNGIYHMAMTGGSWSRVWDSPGGATFYKPAAVSDGSALQVVVTGTDQGVWYTSFNLNSASWARWTILSGTASASPALAIDSNGTINLVIRGTDSSIWHKSKPSGGSWSAWDSAGGITLASPAAVQLGSEVVVVVTGIDNAIWVNQFGSGWQGWKPLGGTAFSPPSLSSTG
ncbi:MAG TPA: alkaline phosphatase family protein [Candidatus Angelobacter sp.]|nr:alkaline phosphatase family protein [Candidatus Angelobacter sp.]